MKKILIFLCLMGLFLSGCNKDKTAINDYVDKDIEKVMVYYEKDGLNCSVWIYMDTAERELSIYSDPEQVTNENYKYVDELNSFIKDNILAKGDIFQDDGLGAGEQGVQKVLWSINIRFEDDTISLSSFTEYPEFWEEFVSLIEK